MIHYKIKKFASSEYWTGYSSQFSKNGVAYQSLEDAGAAIQAQLKNSRNGIKTWADDAQVIAFEVVTNVICSYELVSTIELAKLYESMRKDHGTSFIYGFKQLLKRDKDHAFKYAAQIPLSEYAAFRTTMRDLGFSSRNYKKVGDWIFFSDDDLCMRVKLVGSHSSFVMMDPYMDQYRENTISSPADPSLMTDAVFDDDCDSE